MVKRVYTRVIRRAPRKRWASHIESYIIGAQNGTQAPTNVPNIAAFKELAKNSNDMSVPTPMIIKTGRYKVSCELTLDLTQQATAKDPGNYIFMMYLFFLPQGSNLESPTEHDPYQQAKYRFLAITNLCYNHPEWILAKKQIDCPQSQVTQMNGKFYGTVTFMSSKLKRNLNSGDSIVLGITCQSVYPDAAGQTPYGFVATGSVDYKSCAN